MPQRTPDDGARPEGPHDSSGRPSQELVDKPIGFASGEPISMDGIWNKAHGKIWKENEEMLEACERFLLQSPGGYTAHP